MMSVLLNLRYVNWDRQNELIDFISSFKVKKEKVELIVYCRDLGNGFYDCTSDQDDYLAYVEGRKLIRDSKKYKSLKLVELY